MVRHTRNTRPGAHVSGGIGGASRTPVLGPSAHPPRDPSADAMSCADS